MRKGHVTQRHVASCPRDQNGELQPHRCRGPWKFTVDFGRRPDGGRRQVTRSGFSTKREAQQALDAEIEKQRAGIASDHTLTVQRFLDDWLRGKRNLRDTTRRNYETHVRRYLTPALGHYRLDALRADHIDTLYNDLMNGRYTGTGTATVHHVHRTLRSALNTAVKRRLIQWNPALQVELPEHRRAETTVWEPQQIADFLDACSHHRLYALFHVLTFTGMRRGEAIGTHWKDVDLDRGHITVRSQVIDAGAGPKLGAPKTHAGARASRSTPPPSTSCASTESGSSGSGDPGATATSTTASSSLVTTATCCARTPSPTCSSTWSARPAYPSSGCTTCGTRTRASPWPPASTSRSSAPASGTRRARSRATSTCTSCRSWHARPRTPSRRPWRTAGSPMWSRCGPAKPMKATSGPLRKAKLQVKRRAGKGT